MEIPCRLHDNAIPSAENSIHIFLLPTPQNPLILSRALDHQSGDLAKRTLESWKAMRMPSCCDTVENKREKKKRTRCDRNCSMKSPAVVESTHIVQRPALVEDLRPWDNVSKNRDALKAQTKIDLKSSRCAHSLCFMQRFGCRSIYTLPRTPGFPASPLLQEYCKR